MKSADRPERRAHKVTSRLAAEKRTAFLRLNRAPRLLTYPVVLALAAIFCMLPALASAQAQPAAGTQDSVAVATAWVLDLDAHDFNSALSLLDDGAYLIFSDTSGDYSTFTGKAEIRDALSQYLTGEAHVTLSAGPEVVNGTTTWTETYSNNNLAAAGISTVDFGVDAIIEGGKIKSLIYELTDDSVIRLAAAHAPVHPAIPVLQTPSGSGIGMPRTGSSAWAEPLASAVLLVCALVSVWAGMALRAFARGRAG